jgi:hypothetical protein
LCSSLEDLAGAASGGSAASELKSRAALDEGGFLYLDFYPAGLAACVSKPRIKEALEGYGDSAISSAMYADGERIRANCFVPADIIQRTAEGMQAMKAAKREKKSKNDD